VLSVDAVCFDLDGTICVPRRPDEEFNRAVFARAGVEPLFTPRELRALGPADIDRANDVTEFYTNLYRAAVRNYDTGVDPDSPLVEELGAIAGDLHDPTAVRFREGADRVLEHVGDRYPVGLVTNGKREVQTAKLNALGIADRFDAAVFCHPDRGVEPKPAREPFETALRELSTAGSRTAHVGNSHAEDVVGAHGAGLETVWAPTNRTHEDPPADPEPSPTFRADSLVDLLDVV
jgi:putative hydrolase of the HAD superfamily